MDSREKSESGVNITVLSSSDNSQPAKLNSLLSLSCTGSLDVASCHNLFWLSGLLAQYRATVDHW